VGIQADEVIGLRRTSGCPVWGGLVRSEAVERIGSKVLSFHPQVFCLLRRELTDADDVIEQLLGTFFWHGFQSEKVVAV